ncbi:MAG: ATP-binding cassette domain-containing protein [Acidobacteria bacterium]|nr:ATP-binding cassette domain-containing protein [Acidobacteriota bacterium]
MSLIEKLPPPLQTLTTESGSNSILIAVKADLSLDGSYNEEWLVINKDRLRIFQLDPFSSNGRPPASRLDIPIAELKSPRAESLIGGGALLATVDGETVELVRYSNSRQRVFRRVSKYLNDLAEYHEAIENGEEEKPEPVLEEDTDEEKYCRRCGLLLPEGTAVCPACLNKRRVAARLAQYLKPFRKQTIILSALLLASTLLGLVSPYLMRPLMDVVLVPSGEPRPLQQRFFWLAVILCGMLATQLLAQMLTVVQGRVSTSLSHKLAHSLRVELYQHLQRLSLNFFDHRKTGSLMNRLTQDTQELENVLTNGAQFFIANFLTLLGIIVVLLLLNWQLFLLVMIPIPFVILLSHVFRKRMQRLWPRWWHVRGLLNSAIHDNLSGIRVVKAFAQETREIERFQPLSSELTEAGIRTGQTWLTMFSILTFTTGLGSIIVWSVGGMQVLVGELTLGTLLTFIAFLSMFYGPLQFANRFSEWLTRTLAAADRVFEILDTAPSVTEATNPVAIARINGRVDFKNVTFGYDAHNPVIKNLTLSVKAGEMIGLVGHSGAGKSTTINLLCRLYDVNEGQICIDGIDVRKIRQQDLRSQIGLVMQDPFLFNGTIAENISYSKSAATREEIIEAAMAANAHDFIAAKPDGYDTIVGERGNALSGGERQRLSIARAILHNPRILVLDEATSSVDTDAEKQIQDAIARLIKGRTTFAIAHRLSTLRYADRLVVFKGGAVEEVGTHDELLAKQGEFHRLVQMQQEMSRITAIGG